MLAVSLLLGHRRSIDLATSKLLASRQWIANLMIGVSGATAPAHVMGLQGDLARLKRLDLVAESGVTGFTKEIAQCNPRVDEPIPKGCGGEPAVDCELDVCSDWGKGSTTCGGGEKGRTRKVKTEAKAGEEPCG